MFVCSDIQEVTRETPGKNEIEAEVLIKEVQKYCTKWPRNWSKDKGIGIMSPSADQVNILFLPYMLIDSLGI